MSENQNFCEIISFVNYMNNKLQQQEVYLESSSPEIKAFLLKLEDLNVEIDLTRIYYR